jgi:Putative peptidoglycan binding domain
MKKIAIAMLTTAMMGTPVFAASNNDQQQPPQGAQMQQPQNSDQAQQGQNYKQAQQTTQDQRQNSKNQQSAENSQPIQPNSLSRDKIRQVQQVLDKDGFNAGTADGRWGPRTQNAVKQFQQSKQIQPNGQLNQPTVADLGLDSSKFSQSQQK